MKGWPTAPLSTLGEIVTGATPKTGEQAFFGGPVPFVTPSELDTSEPITIAERTLSDLGAQQVRSVPPGAIMVSCIGSIGKVGMAGTRVATNQQINSVIFDLDRVAPRFGYYACRWLAPALNKAAASTTVSIVNKSAFGRLEIPVPPLTEQRRIAAILDEADALRAKRRAALAQLDELIQSMFLDLISGQQSRQWSRVMLADAFWFQEGPGVRKWQFTEAGVKLLNVGNIERDGSLNLAKTDRHVSEEEAYGKYKHFLAEAGDLVIASSGISFDEDGLLRTRGAFVSREHLPLCMNTSTIRFKALEGRSDLRFLWVWLNSVEFRSQITRLVTGSAQQNFGPSHLKALEITLPPLSVQARFADQVAGVEQLKEAARMAAVELDSLFAALQHRAFCGEL